MYNLTLDVAEKELLDLPSLLPHTQLLEGEVLASFLQRSLYSQLADNPLQMVLTQPPEFVFKLSTFSISFQGTVSTHLHSWPAA